MFIYQESAAQHLKKPKNNNKKQNKNKTKQNKKTKNK